MNELKLRCYFMTFPVAFMHEKFTIPPKSASAQHEWEIRGRCSGRMCLVGLRRALDLDDANCPERV